ncbi:hypothetical protein [Dendronalium sp. ChiSLP03b]|uniref:hypothetical protein n=1 Tax=Dendronalium sp. ChiSLP03b TaxID=3075381 RepID=UPI002AD4D752|nr:hypothetical protein [Dendronalium sp. ChiSLP03b]MDZ8207319.1 hypothetical protein [Dendronalium sp. ChiSLP03b]
MTTVATTGRQPRERVSRLERTAVGTPRPQWLPMSDANASRSCQSPDANFLNGGTSTQLHPFD